MSVLSVLSVYYCTCARKIVIALSTYYRAKLLFLRGTVTITKGQIKYMPLKIFSPLIISRAKAFLSWVGKSYHGIQISELCIKVSKGKIIYSHRPIIRFHGYFKTQPIYIHLKEDEDESVFRGTFILPSR